jgi:glycerate dehydrogenase
MHAEKPVAVVLDEGDLMDGGLGWPELEALVAIRSYRSTAPADIVSRAADATIVLTNKTPLDAQTIAALPRLRFITVLATGFNVIDIHAARTAGIPVSNVPAYATECVAQHTWALILELSNRVGEHASSVNAGTWSASGRWCYWQSSPFELAGKRLGLIGRGPIALRVADIGRAFGMEVMIASLSHPAGGPGLSALDEVIRTSDVLSLHCRLTAEHSGMVNAALLGSMKPGALLINTARGGLVQEHDLAEALASGRIGGAALDVLAQEPPSADHPLIGAPNCIITPHMAWSGKEARQRLIETTVGNVRAYLAGAPQHVVNA